MKYYIKIFKLVENREYEAQLKEWEEYSRYRPMNESRRPEFEVKEPALETILTEEEFNKVRKACIEVM